MLDGAGGCTSCYVSGDHCSTFACIVHACVCPSSVRDLIATA